MCKIIIVNTLNFLPQILPLPAAILCVPAVSNQYWPVLFTFYYVIQRQRKTKLQEYSKENLEIDYI